MSAGGGLNQGVGDGSEADGCEDGAWPIQIPGRARVATFRHTPQRDEYHDDCKREVDKEDPAPGKVFDQPAAEHRTDCGGDCGKGGPGSDGAASLSRVKRGADEGQTAGDKQGCADALQAAGEDERGHGRSEPAPDGGKGEEEHSGDKDFSAPVEIAERAAQEQKGREQECVGLNDPLDVAYGCVEGRLQCGESYVDRGAVNEGHAGAEDGGDQNP